MKQKLAMNQINRKRRRLKAQRRKNTRIAIASLVFILVFAFIIKPYVFDDEVASADTAKLLSEQEALDEQKNYVKEEKDSEPEIEEVKSTITEELQSYMLVNSDTTIYKEKTVEGKALVTVKAGDYIKFYGSEGGWSKVNHKNVFGFIRTDKLNETKEGNLTIKDGVLYVDKDNTIPSDFNGDFDVEAENSLLIAIEAMRREGLEINIGRRYTTFAEEESHITNNTSKYPTPDAYTSELRTGYALEICSPKTDPRIYNNFFGTAEGKWVRDNMHKYGFVLRYPEGKEEVTGFKSSEHIYRYVGVEIAKKMYDNNLTMEEYFN